MEEGLKDEVREAVSAGQNVQDAIREITLKALKQRELDHEALGRVTRDVLAAVREAAEARGGASGDAKVSRSMREAVDGLDEALATAAQAMRLSLEEAVGRVQQFSREDLARARRDLGDVERLYLDSLRDAARSARGAAGDVLEDLARHARASGTAVGRQLERTSPLAGSLAHAARVQFEVGVGAAAASGAMLARVASGVLAGLADALSAQQRAQRRDPPR